MVIGLDGNRVSTHHYVLPWTLRLTESANLPYMTALTDYLTTRDNTNLGHWRSEVPMPNDAIGIVYVITTTDGRKYCGCKTMIKTAPKRKTDKRKRIVDSDWRTYTSSSWQLDDQITDYEILTWCTSKWEMRYAELLVQVHNQVLIDPNWLNGIINVRLGKCPKRTLERIKSKDFNLELLTIKR